MKQLKMNIQGDEETVNKKIEEEFTLKNATIYGGYNLFCYDWKELKSPKTFQWW